MRPRLVLLWLVSVTSILAIAGADAGAARAQPAGPVVDILELSGPVDPPTLAAIRDLVADAEDRGAELVVVRIDTPGGLAVTAVDAVDPIATAAVPVAVFVGPGAASAAGAGTFLLAAAHVGAASEGAILGPACPAAAGRPCAPSEQQLAARLVANDALVDLEVPGIEALLVELDGREVATAAGTRTLRLPPDEVTVRLHKLGLLRRTLHAVLHPVMVHLLLVGVLLLLLFEVFQPGFGVAGVAAVLLAPLAVYGLVVLPVVWWALALVVVGLLLLAIDLAIAGLGLPTAGGAAAIALGSWWLFPREGDLLVIPWWVVTLVVLTCLAFFVPVMTVVLRAQAGPAGDAGADLVGDVGVVRSTMNPEGHVFVAGALWRARWAGGTGTAVRAGRRVRVTGVDGAVLLVEDVEPAASQAGQGAPDG